MEQTVYISTSCLTGNRALDRVLRSYLNQGLHHIELSAPHPYLPLNQLASMLKELQTEFKNDFILHNYFPIPEKDFVFNPSTPNSAIRQMVYDHADAMIRIAQETQAELCTFHTGYLYDASENPDGTFAFDKTTPINEAKAISNSVELVRYMNLKLRQQGAYLGIENLFPAKDGLRHSLFCSFEEMETILDQIPEEVGLLLDLGHLNISATVMKFDKWKCLDRLLSKYARRIYELHISENNGFEDQHQTIREDSWQCEAIARTCRMTRPNPFALKVIFEARKLDINSILRAQQIIKRSVKSSASISVEEKAKQWTN